MRHDSNETAKNRCMGYGDGLMACDTEWVTGGNDKTIQGTKIKLRWTQSSCSIATFNATLPWAPTATYALRKGESKQFTNPSNTSETIVIRVTDLWCTSSGEAAQFEVCREVPETTGKIRCISTPSGATIYFNGRRMSNTTPTTLTNVEPKTWHTIKFEKDGFESISDQYYVEAGQTKVAEKILTPIVVDGHIRAVSDLDGVTAKIMIDGTPATHTVPHTFTVKAGYHTVTFTKPNHEFVEKGGTVQSGKTIEIKGNPTPITADTVLTLNSLPETVVAGDELTLSGTLKTTDGSPVLGNIKFYDKDTLSSDDPLLSNGTHVSAMTNGSTGAFSVKWKAAAMDLAPIKTNVIAKFDGSATHNASESNTQTITFVIIPNTVLTLDKVKSPVHLSEQLTLSGTLKTENGIEVPNAEISFWDHDPLAVDQQLKENNVNLTTNTDASGNYSTKWSAVTMDLPAIRMDLKAKFGGIKDKYKPSESSKQMIEFETRQGELEIVSEPVGATIYINDVKKPQTAPYTYSVDLGEYTVKMEFGEFEPFTKTVDVVFEKPTIVHHQFTTPYNLCTLLGYDKSNNECVNTIWGLFIEFGTPLVEMGIIKNNVNMVTGENETPTKWTYLFFILGCIPVAGTTIKTVSKNGLVLTSKGSKLAELAKLDPVLAETLKEQHVIAKMCSMTDSQLDDLIKAAEGKNYDDAKNLLDGIDVVDLTPAKKAEIQQNVAKGVGDNAADDVMKHIDDSFTASHFVSYGNPAFWDTYFVKRLLDGEELINGGLGQKLADMCLEVADLGKSFPITKTKLFIDNLVSAGRYDELISTLAKSSEPNAKILSEYLEVFRRVEDGKGAFDDQEIYEAVLRKIGSITHDAMAAHDTATMAKLSGVLLDESGKLKPLSQIAESDWFKSILKITPVDMFAKYSGMLLEISSGLKTAVTRTEVDEFLQMAIDFPNTANEVMKTTDIVKVMDNLAGIGSTESKSMLAYIKSLSKIDTRFTNDEILSITSKSAEGIKSILKTAPDSIDSVIDATGDMNELIIQLSKDTLNTIDDATRFNLINELEATWDAIKLDPTKTHKIVAQFAKKYMKAVWEYARTHPGYAIATSVGIITMSMWFNSDNSPFYWFLWNKHNGNDPGTRSYRVGQHIAGLKTQAFLCKSLCQSKDYEQLAISLETYKSQLEAFRVYVENEDNRNALEAEESLDIADNGLESYTELLDTDEMEKCLPADIPIPEDGLIEDVFVSRIIDGDTIECEKDGEKFNVRIVGVNTPDKGAAGYSASCTETKGSEPNPVWCSKDTYTKSIQAIWDLADDKKISLKINPDDKQDHYGRYIAVLMNNANQEINLELIKSGYACYFHRSDFGDTTLIDHDVYIAARNAARTAKLGIWAPFELNKNIGSVIFKAFRLKTDGSPTGLTVEVHDENGYLYNSSTTKKQYWETGEQTVTFKLTGYADKKVDFVVLENRTIIAEATMSEGDEPIENPGYVIFRSYRKSSTGSLVAVTSDVYIDNIFKFRTHASAKQSITEGLYTATFKHPNYEDQEKSFGIQAGETKVIDVTLVELPDNQLPDPTDPTGATGTVDFMSVPTTALIFVEGQYIGTTSKKGYKLSVGTYSMTMEKGGYEPCTKSFTVEEGLRTPVSCTLIESYLPPEDPEYPDPVTPTTPPGEYYPTGGTIRPSGGEYQPYQPTTTPSGEPAPTVGEPWEEFITPMTTLFLNIGKEVGKQDTIIKAAQDFMSKHCDLEFNWESNEHDPVELGEDENGCATLDDTESLTESIDKEIVEDGTKIIYLLWNADEAKCVSYNGFSGGTDDLLFDAWLCSSPTSKSENEFTTTTGKKANIDLKVKYSGTLTIITQLCETLHELFELTKSEDAGELPEFDEEFCGKNIYEDRPNAKCIVEWLEKFNEAIPEEVKERSEQ